MVKIENPADYAGLDVPAELLKGKRHLTAAEIEVLEKNLNHNDDPTWNNFYVDDSENGFDPSLIHLSFFSGFIVLGKVQKLILKYNDLRLGCGIRRSKLSNVVTGDLCVIRNVFYLLRNNKVYHPDFF